jgi:hypothetical protein
MDLMDFLDTLVVWKTTYFRALAIGLPQALGPRLSRSSLCTLQDNYSLVQTSNGTSDHSILITLQSDADRPLVSPI